MRVKLNELKKITASPFFYIIIAVFIVFNAFIISGNSYYKGDFKVLNTIIGKFGCKVDASMLKSFGKYNDGRLGSMNALSKKKTGRTYKSAYAFLMDGDNYNTELYSQKEFNDIKRLNISENYFALASGIDESYGKTDIKAMGEDYIKKYGMSGESAETARGEYVNVAKRFAQLKSTGEEKSLFFIGQIYAMHSFLFADVFRCIIFEIMILVVLLASWIANFEFENKTQLLAYSSKRGRRLIFDKLVVSGVACLAATTVIIGGTLAVYFCTYDYSALLNVPISNALMQEKNDFFLSWWNMSFIQYLFAVIAAVYAVELIFMAIAFCIASFIKNNYIVFAVFALIFLATYIFSGVTPISSNLSIAVHFNPFVLVMNPYKWFMEKGPFASFKYYEVITLGGWAAIMALLYALCGKRFKKTDIC